MERRSNRIIIPLLLIGVGIVLLMLGTVYRFVIQPQLAQPVVTSVLRPESVFPEIPRVALVDARAAYDNKKAVFVDVRAVGSYDQSHIAGALSIPLSNLVARIGELDSDSWIIPY